eukprot:6206819-Pleurochrysis_carterae.AAC.1
MNVKLVYTCTITLFLRGNFLGFTKHNAHTLHTEHHCCAECAPLGETNLEVQVGLGASKITEKERDVAVSECPGALPVGPCGTTYIHANPPDDRLVCPLLQPRVSAASRCETEPDIAMLQRRSDPPPLSARINLGI